MPNRTRCCARCKTPYNCGNPACPCHRSPDIEAAWAEVLNAASPAVRFTIDEARGHRDPNGDDAGLGDRRHKA